MCSLSASRAEPALLSHSDRAGPWNKDPLYELCIVHRDQMVSKVSFTPRANCSDFTVLYNKPCSEETGAGSSHNPSARQTLSLMSVSLLVIHGNRGLCPMRGSNREPLHHCAACFGFNIYYNKGNQFLICPLGAQHYSFC